MKDSLIDTIKLSNENNEILLSLATPNKKGYSIKKDNYIKNGELVEEIIPVLEELNITYDGDEEKFYNLNEETTVYSLPLIPEKYFRVKENSKITIEELNKNLVEITQQLQDILDWSKNEN